MNDDHTLDEGARRAVELANEIADRDEDSDLWDIADGVLAGAIHYWLYSRQPCGDPSCPDCADVSTAELRMRELNRLLHEYAETSEYYHAPTDSNVGRA